MVFVGKASSQQLELTVSSGTPVAFKKNNKAQDDLRSENNDASKSSGPFVESKIFPMSFSSFGLRGFENV